MIIIPTHIIHLVLEEDGFGTDQPFFKCIVAQKNDTGKYFLMKNDMLEQYEFNYINLNNLKIKCYI